MEYKIGQFSMKEDTAITLGKFDGFHSGHQILLACISGSKKSKLKSVAFRLSNTDRKQLLVAEERKSRIKEMGIDYLIECPLIPEITGMEPEMFVSKVLVEELRAKYIVVGSDFRFGHDRKGDGELLKKLQKKYGFVVEVIEKKQYHGRDVSSTYIREELEQGNIRTVNKLLGYPFFVRGEVCKSEQQQISLEVDEKKLLPPEGTYEVLVRIGTEQFKGVTNINYNKGDDKMLRKIVTVLDDCGKELQGKTVEIQFYEHIRPEKERMGE